MIESYVNYVYPWGLLLKKAIRSALQVYKRLTEEDCKIVKKKRERVRKWDREARLGILLGCRRTGGGFCGRRGRVFDTSPNHRWSIAAEIIDDRAGRLITFIAELSSGDSRFDACISSWRTRERKRNFAVARCRNATRITWNYSREIWKRNSRWETRLS